MSKIDEEDDLTLAYMWGRKDADDEIKKLRAENERLREGMRDAIEEVSFWSDYASEHFRKKHDLDGVLAGLRAVLGEDK
jgi:hypothetical protein